jgi:hypothetical protein
MKRRRLLAALGAGVGAATRPAAAVPAGDPRRGRPSSHDVEVPGAPIAGLSVAPVPDDVPLAHEVTVHGQPTTADPATVTVAVANTDDRPHAVRTANRPLSDVGADATDRDDRALLVSSGDAERRDGQWVGRARALPTTATRTLQPGDRLADTFALVADGTRADGGGSLPAGSHSFSGSYALDPGGAGVEYDWGFAVHVED